MIGAPSSPAAPVVNRDLPRAPLRQPYGHSASRAGPSYRLPGRPLAVLDQPTKG